MTPNLVQAQIPLVTWLAGAHPIDWRGRCGKMMKRRSDDEGRNDILHEREEMGGMIQMAWTYGLRPDKDSK